MKKWEIIKLLFFIGKIEGEIRIGFVWVMVIIGIVFGLMGLILHYLKNVMWKMKYKIIIMMVLLIYPASALFAGDSETVYHLDYCNNLTVNVTGSLHIDEGEYWFKDSHWLITIVGHVIVMMVMVMVEN